MPRDISRARRSCCAFFHFRPAVEELEDRCAPAVVTLAVTDASASELGADPGAFTVNRTGSTASPLTVNYSVGGTAANGVDYNTLSGSVTIPTGAASAPIPITPIADALPELSETVVVTVASSPDYTIGSPASGVVTIGYSDTKLVAAGSVWKYLDNGTNQGTAWRATSFNDTAWASGPAQLGYGDGDEATVVSFGPDPNLKYITTYFRRAFSVTSSGQFNALNLKLLRDDGAVVYLNGTEVARSNLPAGTVGFQTLASSAAEGTAESTLFESSINPGLLLSGTNVLAVEVHQASANSPDLSFDLELTGLPTLRFALIGDFGLAGQPEADVANLVKSWNPAFVITTGDNNYPSGAATTIDANIGQYYHNFIFPYTGTFGTVETRAMNNRFFPSHGNHDWAPDGEGCTFPNGLEPSLNYFTLPGNERYYDLRWGPVHLFAVDSDCNEPDGRTSTSVQGTWLQGRLAASTAPWKLPYFHEPPFSSGVHASPVMDWPFKTWGASAVLAGHEHFYERIIRDGFPYIIEGTSGHPTLFEPGAPIPGSQVLYAADFGATHIEANAGGTTFRHVTRGGLVIDTYSLGSPVSTVDLYWTGGGISGPTSATTTSTFTISRSYTVSGQAASGNFTIAYYRSGDAVFGNADDILLGSETITAAADKAVGPHAGASAALQIPVPGTFYLFARVDDGAAVLETHENNNVAQAPQQVTVTGSPVVSVILDNGQPGYSERGLWTDWPGGYNGAYRYAEPVTGDTAVWTVSGLAPAAYLVQATWPAASASDVAYRIYDGPATTPLRTVLVDQRPEPSGPLFGGRPFQTLASVTITGTSIRVEVDGNPSGYVAADAVRVASLPPLDLNWSGGGISGPATASTTATFTVSRTYTISDNASPAGFTVAYYRSSDAVFGNADDARIGTETVSAAADLTVGPHTGTSPALQITFPGTFYLFARVDDGNAILETNENNNVAQAPQTVAVTGAGSVILDNGQPGYSERGVWTDWPGGYNGAYRYAEPVTGDTAVWTVSGLPPAAYLVQVTWPAASASNVVYRIYDGPATTPLRTVLVDQRLNPSGPVFGGRPFQTLAGVTITGTSIRVEVDGNPSGYVAADAVRVTSLLPLDLNWSGGGITGPASATTTATFTVSRTYTVSGNASPSSFTIAYYRSGDTVFGNADDARIGTETLSAAAALAVGPHAGTSPALQITFPGAFHLFARLDDGDTVLETNEANNVAQAPQTVTVTGTGSAILDNGQPGYSERGTWFDWTGGYNGAYRYADPGNGNTAIWMVSGLPTGTYLVQATWVADSASDVVYRIYDGASTTPLRTVLVDQRVNASGPLFGGRRFQTLATVTITGTSIRVEVDSNFSGYVSADAVRVESASPLRAAGGAVPGIAGSVALTPALAEPFVAEARARWAAAGVDGQSLNTASRVTVWVADLGGDYLGLAFAEVIWLDQDAAGHGWFIDAAPATDEEFDGAGQGPAAQQMDLLTVVVHELGHLLGFDHEETDGPMAETLAPGVRRVPAAQQSAGPVPGSERIDLSSVPPGAGTDRALADPLTVLEEPTLGARRPALTASRSVPFDSASREEIEHLFAGLTDPDLDGLASALRSALDDDLMAALLDDWGMADLDLAVRLDEPAPMAG